MYVRERRGLFCGCVFGDTLALVETFAKPVVSKGAILLLVIRKQTNALLYRL